MRSLNPSTLVKGFLFVMRWGMKTSPALVILNLVLTLLTAALPPLQVWLIGAAVNAAVVPGGIELGRAALLAGVLAASFGGTSAINTFRNVGSERLVRAISLKVQTDYLERLGRQTPADMENAAERDRLTLLWETATTRVSDFLDQGTVWIAFLLSTLGVVGVLVSINPLVALLVLSGTLVPLFVTVVIFGVWDEVNVANAKLGRVSSVLAVHLVSPAGFLDGRVNGNGGPEAQRYLGLLRQQADNHLRGVDKEALYYLFSAVWTILTLGGAVLLLLQQGGTAGQVAASLAAVTQTTMLTNLLFMAGSLAQLTPYLVELGDYLRSGAEGPGAAGGEGSEAAATVTATSGVMPTEEVDPPAHGIDLREVTYTYPGTDLGVRDVSVGVAPGQILSLVGPNGAGKSTALKIMAGAYPIASGIIQRDGEPLAPLTSRAPDARRPWCAAQLQDQPRPPVTLREYLQAGSSEVTDGELVAALTAAGLPVRYGDCLDQTLGQEFEDGLAFSGGQWQMVGLARLLLSPARLWLLDEPSSALDPDGEVRLLSTVREHMGDRCVVLVSHRLSTVLRTDRVAVVKDGTVIETGAPRSLLRDEDSEFYRLFAAQIPRDDDEPGIVAAARM